MKKKETPDIILYQAPNGAIEFARDSDRETLWASLDQIASVFGRDKSVISRHIKNIFREEELDTQSTVAFFATVQKEGKRDIKRTIEHYNLDMILSIGYRVNSKVATEFRKWATKTLKRHMTEGYTIHRKLLEKNYTLFQSALADIQSISQNTLSSDDVLELIKAFSATWFSLDAFDTERFHSIKQTQGSVRITTETLTQALHQLKKNLAEQGEATDFFAREKESGNFAGIVWNIFQTAFQEDVYPSIESKASHLLYFIVKNHPFIDGNKRSGAFAFIWFLQKAEYSFRGKISPEALTAITLLIAQSHPQEKQRMIDLVILLLSGK